MSYLLAPQAIRRHLTDESYIVWFGSSFLSYSLEQIRVRNSPAYPEPILSVLFLFPYINIFMQMSKEKLNFHTILEYPCGIWGVDQQLPKARPACQRSCPLRCKLVSISLV